MQNRLIALFVAAILFIAIVPLGREPVVQAADGPDFTLLTGDFESVPNDELSANTYASINVYSPLMYDPAGYFDRFAGNSSTDFLYIDTTVKYEGNKSLKMSYMPNDVPGIASTRMYFYEVIPAANFTEGKAYKFSVYIKTEDITPEDSYGNGISISINENTYNTQSSVITGTADWQEKSITFTYNDTMGDVKVGIDMRDSSGTVWADNIRVCEILPDMPDLGFKFPGFEGPNGGITGDSDGWWSYSSITLGSPFSADTEVFSEGAQSLKIDHTGQSQSSSIVWQNFTTVSSGTLYRITGKLKLNGVTVASEDESVSTYGASIRIDIRNSNGDSVRTVHSEVLRGTKDWVDCVAELVLSPDEASFSAGVTLLMAEGVLYADDLDIVAVIDVKSPTGNSIVNGGFEGLTLENWETLGFLKYVDGAQTISFDETVKYSGAQSLKIESSEDDKNVSIWQVIDKGFVVGKTYRFTGYLKTDDIIPADENENWHGGHLKIIVKDAGGADLREVTGTAVIGDTDWTKYTVDYTVQEGDAKLLPTVAFRYATGTLWADNLDFMRVYTPELADPTKIVNAGFEELNKIGGDSGVYGYWTYSASPSGKYTGNNVDDYLRIVDDEAHTGNQSCILEHPVASDTIMWQNISSEAGKYYRAEVWIKTADIVPLNEEEDWHGAQLKFYTRLEGNIIQEKVKRPVATGTTDWTKYTLDVYTESGEDMIQVVAGLRQATGTMWIDDFAFYEISEDEYEDISVFIPDDDDDDDDGDPVPETGDIDAITFIIAALTFIMMLVGIKLRKRYYN